MSAEALKHASPVERDIATRLVRELLAADLALTVHDDGEVVLRRSVDEATILAALCSTGSDVVFGYRDGKRVGWVLLVWGNDRDLISDGAGELAYPETEAYVEGLE